MPRTRAPRDAAAAAYAARPWSSSYPPGVPAEVDVPQVPLTRLLDDAAARFPSRTAVAFLGSRTTYAQLRQQVDRLAAALSRRGIAAGDRVAVVLPNCPQSVIAAFAALRIGAVVVELNPQYTEAELLTQLSDSGARAVVCLDKVCATIEALQPQTAVEVVVVTSVTDYLPAKDRLKLRLPTGKARKQRARLTAQLPASSRAVPLLPLLHESQRAQQVPVDPGSPALIQYTTGTSGTTKGAVLTHRNLVANAHQCAAWMPDAQPGREVTLAVLPLYHAYGFTLCVTTTLLLGGTIVLVPRFDQELVLRTITELRPTMFPGVPPLYKALLDNPKTRQHDLRSIRACLSGAMTLPAETQEQFEKVTGGRLVEGFGMTETSPVALANPLTGRRKPGTVGVPVPSTEVRVVDPSDPAVVVPLGSEGELAIRGPQVFAGYWERPEESAAAFGPDGWLLTGDIAVMDEDGFVTIVDRKKEIVISGGFNIYPAEVDEVICSLPGVTAACCVGVPDRYRGESLKAFVVLEPGASVSEDDVLAHAAASLAAYKVPTAVEVRDSLPTVGALGKVARRVLRDEEIAKAEPEDLAAVPAGKKRKR